MISLRKSTSLLSSIGKRALTLGLMSLVALTNTALAGSREQALQIHNRVAGVPPTETVLINMAQMIEANNVAGAVDLAMDNEAFYSATLKNMATPWTNREQTVFAPLNDYVATVIGMVRDDKDFRTLLYGNILYTSNASGLPAYSNSNNDHYAQAQAQSVSLKNTLVERQQSQVTGLPVEAVSGVITSRAAAKAFFIDGTNRAMFRFTLMNHLCRDLEQVHDVTLVPDYIRQDVSRSPGGDSQWLKPMPTTTLNIQQTTLMQVLFTTIKRMTFTRVKHRVPVLNLNTCRTAIHSNPVLLPPIMNGATTGAKAPTCTWVGAGSQAYLDQA